MFGQIIGNSNVHECQNERTLLKQEWVFYWFLKFPIQRHDSPHPTTPKPRRPPPSSYRLYWQDRFTYPPLPSLPSILFDVWRGAATEKKVERAPFQIDAVVIDFHHFALSRSNSSFGSSTSPSSLFAAVVLLVLCPLEPYPHSVPLTTHPKWGKSTFHPLNQSQQRTPFIPLLMYVSIILFSHWSHMHRTERLTFTSKPLQITSVTKKTCRNLTRSFTLFSP